MPIAISVAFNYPPFSDVEKLMESTVVSNCFLYVFLDYCNTGNIQFSISLTIQRRGKHYIDVVDIDLDHKKPYHAYYTYNSVKVE